MFFFAGFGATSAFGSAMPVNLGNFERKRLGVINTILLFPYNLSPIIIAILYSTAYAGQAELNPSLQQDSLAGFFLLQAISWPVIFALGCIFLREYPPESQAPTENSDLVNDTNDNAEDGTKDFAVMSCPKNISEKVYSQIITSDVRSVWGWVLITDVDFQLFLWPFIIFIGVIGVLHSDFYFWMFFTSLHCISCLVLSFQVRKI